MVDVDNASNTYKKDQQVLFYINFPTFRKTINGIKNNEFYPRLMLLINSAKK